MPFQRFVETGRIAKCSAGPLKGRIVAIVDVIDQNRVLIDGPFSRVPRQEYRLSNLHLTRHRIKFPYTAPTRVVRKVWQESNMKQEWRESSWSKKGRNICKRARLNDYDRFKLRHAKRQRNKLLTIAFKSLKRRTKDDGTARVVKRDKSKAEKIKRIKQAKLDKLKEAPKKDGKDAKPAKSETKVGQPATKEAKATKPTKEGKVDTKAKPEAKPKVVE